jgi:PAS domain S-box-containing protein
MNKSRMLLVFAFFMAVLTGCGKTVKEQSDLPTKTISFRDIPGVTSGEINAIEALQKKYGSFVYGTNHSTGAFTGKDGEVQGYTALFCGWLAETFEIPFKIKFYEPGGLAGGLESGDIDFIGESTSAPEPGKPPFMTSPIIQRSIKIYRLEHSLPIEDIIHLRPPRYAFFKGSVLHDDIPASASANAGYYFETVYIDNYNAVYNMLKNGGIDAYIGLDSSEAAFDEYGNVVSEDFFPLISKSSCLSTQKKELEPVISVLEKALDERTLDYLAGLYKEGYQQYLENKLYNLLTDEERAYIQNKPSVPIAVEYSNYPICFYDTNTSQWQGIYFDVLQEITKLTGLSFERANDQNTQYNDLIRMLENGEALIVPELFRMKEYENRFLWSEIPLLQDTYAFMSKSNFKNIEISQVPYLKIGFRGNSIYSEFFKKMFPSHRHFIEYDSQEEGWNSLKLGEVDVIFACSRRLITYTNFYEEAGYKLNLILNYSFDSSFGYNKDAAVLKSVIDKSLSIININNIKNQWMHKSYDYRYKLVQAQRPWLIGASVLSFLVLLLVSIFLIRSRSSGRHLETLVRQRTNELAYQSSLLETMIDSLPDGVFCKDVNLKYTLCNKYMADIFGRKLDDILGKDDVKALGFPVETAAAANDVDRKVINEHRRITFEEWLPCADGVKRLFETVKVPLVLDGETVGILGIGRDITQRKTMEEEIQAASRAKTAFLANMSHEIRTPLNVIIGLTDLALEDDLPDKRLTDNLIKINNAGSTLLSIVNDILDFSKIESGRLQLTPVEYYISSLLNDVVTLALIRLEEKPVTFNLNISEDLPAKLYGDDLRVKQIFTNLLGNAVKYTHHGSIDFNIRCTRENDTIWTDVEVKDTGIGIRGEDMKKLFSDYNQVNTRANRNIEGTGLGLSITKRLVEMMDGKIIAESEYGKGTAFRLRIRQGYVDDTSIGHELAGKLRSFRYTDDKRIASKKLVRHNLSYAKVLVVDDMQTNLDVAASLLRKYMMQVDCLDNGHAAIERIREGAPAYNAIFMDHMMPGMDGTEVADAIRALGTEYALNIPIIALTANAIHGTEEIFYEHGFQAFIPKPIDIMELDSIIRKWVRSESQEKALGETELVTDIPETAAPDKNEEDLAINIPGVDTKKGIFFYGGDMDIYLPLLRSYISNTPEVLKKLKTVSKETLSSYVITVHGLKGTSASIGAEQIREAALNLEDMARAGNLDEVLAGNGSLIHETEIIVANIKAWLEQYDAKNAKPRMKAPDREVLVQLRQSCEKYDMNGIDIAMAELERADYEEDADLVEWLKRKIEVSEIAEAAERLVHYEKELIK